MTSASKCFALEEWDACVFNSMRVLEHGLRWLAGQINAGPFPLTLSKPVELECWENIIENIKARIDEELGPSPPGSSQRPKKTAEREKVLAFYAKAAAEFRYFKDAWRNHVAHDRHDPYEEPEALLVMGHVASFMQTLAARA